jgi:hypothetical protein
LEKVHLDSDYAGESMSRALARGQIMFSFLADVDSFSRSVKAKICARGIIYSTCLDPTPMTSLCATIFGLARY